MKSLTVQTVYTVITQYIESPLKDSRPLSGCGNLLDDATPNFISDSGSSILGLSNDISFVSEFFLEVVKIKF